MATALGDEQKYSLITRRLEIQNGWSGQKLQSLLAQGKGIRYQWAHIGYFIPLIKFADFIRAGGEIVVEFIDTYAFLVNYKFPWEQVRHRTKYYKALITAALKAVGVPMSYVSMVEMSSYQVTQQYMVDFWKLCALCSQQDARDTGAEVGASTMLSPLLTPLLQELGEEYLGVDAEFGGTDQRGIFNLGEQFLPDLGYEKRAHLLNELLPSLTGGKMSSSHPAHTTIMFLDDADAVVEKLAGAACPPGTVGRREWVFVPPPPEGCALVHGASSLARLSLGRLRSPLHRVTQPADGAGKRYFLSYFLRPEHRVRETWAAKDSIGTVA